ncbi:hypothetical protein HDR63_04020 [bacterium]|nr:hypothetical protein [bacterium]
MFMRSGFLAIMAVMATMSGATALDINSPDVAPAVNIKTGSWVDGNTNRWIKTPTEAQLKQFQSGLGAGGDLTAPAPKTVTKSSMATRMGKVGGALSLATGAMMVADATSGDGPHSWGNVLEGAAGGLAAGMGAGALLNAIPGFGQVAYGVVVAGATVLGGLSAGSQIFSETDCMTDPATGAFTCCNTYFNEGQRFVGIGGEMFCEFPGVRQCLQGGQPVEASWWDGLWLDDDWGACQPKYCQDIPAVASGTDPNTVVAAPFLDNETGQKACWAWECVEGYQMVALADGTATCVGQNDDHGNPMNTYDRVIQTIEKERARIIAECGEYL